MAELSDDNHGSDMQGKPIAPQKLAALIDGRLADDEREALLRQLGQSEEDLETASIAAAATAHLKETEAAKVLPLRSESRSRVKWSRVVVAGSSLAAAAAILIVVQRNSGPSEFAGAGQMAAALTNKSALPADWNYSPWSARRGSDVIDDTTAILRIGVRSVDLSVGLGANDSVVRSIANEMSDLMNDVPGGSASGSIYQELANQPGSASLRSQARSAIDALPRQDLVKKGSWLEAARIAAAHRDERWFSLKENDRMLRRIASDQSIPASQRIWVTDVRKKRFEWSSISESLDKIISRF